MGLCLDEEKRYMNLKRKYENASSPAYDFGYTEKMCMDIAKDLNLLSPVYERQFRDGCFFCSKQPLDSLRNIYYNYPELWNIMLTWDADEPKTTKFKAYHSVLDYDKRFKYEDLYGKDRPFKWKYIE